MPKVTIADTLQIFDVPAGSVMFDAVAECGTELPHGCLAGSCGACRIQVLSGAMNLAPATVIENNTLEAIRDEYAKREGPSFLEGKQIRLACRARVNGNVTVLPMDRKKT